MRNPNGFGGIRKLKGKRRKPFQVVITTGRILVDGKQKQEQKTVGYAATREEAMLILADYNKTPFDLSRETTFEDIYKKLDVSRTKTQSKRALITAYGKCKSIKQMKIREIKKPQLQRIADSLSGNSISTQAQVRILWNLVFKYAMENDIIEKDYSQYVKFYSDFEPRKKEPFTIEQIRQFSDDLLILCYTGLRISEYLSLMQWDIKDGCIYVQGTKTASAVRIVPIHEKIADKLSLRLSGRFPINYAEFKNKTFDPEMESLEILGHTIHDTRRTFATFADKSGMDKVMVKRILGHKLKDLTEEVYISKDVADLKEEMNKLTIL